MTQPTSSEITSGSRGARARIAVLGLIVLILANVAAWAVQWEHATRFFGTFPMTRTEENLEFAKISKLDISNLSVPLDQLRTGGPPRDGIPAIMEPHFIPAHEARHLTDTDVVVGVVHNGTAKAYPFRVLVWHEIVNDEIDEIRYAVTYCPLCGTAMVFDRYAAGRERTFGVSGFVYNSDVLMYDHQDEALWSQLKMEAISGPSVGAKLSWLPSHQMTWKAWRESYPESLVLSDDTGHIRMYGNDPYGSYAVNDKIVIPVPQTRKELPMKSWVFGVVVNGVPKAYPRPLLIEVADPTVTIHDEIAGDAIRLVYESEADYAAVHRIADNAPLPVVRVYWFAWQAFYPDTLVYEDGTVDIEDSSDVP